MTYSQTKFRPEMMQSFPTILLRRDAGKNSVPTRQILTRLPLMVKPINFGGYSLQELGKMSLVESMTMIHDAAPGEIGLEELKKLTAMRLLAALRSVVKNKAQKSVQEITAGVRGHIENILLCRPFLTPQALVICENVLENDDGSSDNRTALQEIVDIQRQLHLFVHKYGNLAIAPQPCMLEGAFAKISQALNKLHKKHSSLKIIIDALAEGGTSAEHMRWHILQLHIALSAQATKLLQKSQGTHPNKSQEE